MLAAQKLFGPAALYLPLIDAIVPTALKHEYSFVSDEWFGQFIESDKATPKAINQIIVFELLDKSHLAAVTALLRTKRWADAACLLYDANNFVGWAGTVRGLIESAGDTMDGLLNIAYSLAKHHAVIAESIAGKDDHIYGFSDLENVLDHFVHARWMRTKKGEESILKAKENVTYVRLLEAVIPNVEKAYHRLCSITHPSADSIEYFYESHLDGNVDGNRGFRLSATNDQAAISDFLSAHPSILPNVLMMSCNPPLLILRVLHKFRNHPKLSALKSFDFSAIKIWPAIERLLK
jgi:hypothetical protein